jgi:hypothetical protein
MRKLVTVAVLSGVLALYACAQAYVAIKNDCTGVEFRMSKLEGDGKYTVMQNRLQPGQRILIELTGVAAQPNKFVIMADAFRIGDGMSLGTAFLELWVTPSPGVLTGPMNNEHWEISQVYPGGCPLPLNYGQFFY